MAQGNTMNHYSKHEFISLTPEQQQLVEQVSWNIYRPCCGNPTYFPDCNHGMAMLGLLELMASQGVNEEDMYKAALAVNSYWFPETYINLAKYFESQGTPWKKLTPKKFWARIIPALPAIAISSTKFNRLNSKAAADAEYKNE